MSSFLCLCICTVLCVIKWVEKWDYFKAPKIHCTKTLLLLQQPATIFLSECVIRRARGDKTVSKLMMTNWMLNLCVCVCQWVKGAIQMFEIGLLPHSPHSWWPQTRSHTTVTHTHTRAHTEAADVSASCWALRSGFLQNNARSMWSFTEITHEVMRMYALMHTHTHIRMESSGYFTLVFDFFQCV